MELLISDELRAELGNNISILPSKRSRGRSERQQIREERKPISASAQKKLAKIQQAKIDRALRTERLNSIRSRSLSEVEVRLLHSSGRVGQRDSRRETVKRHLLLERSGLTSLSSDLELTDDDDDVGETSPIESTDLSNVVESEESRPGNNSILPSPSISSSNQDQIMIIPNTPASIPVVHIADRPKRRRRVLMDLTSSSSLSAPISSPPPPPPPAVTATDKVSDRDTAAGTSDITAIVPDDTHTNNNVDRQLDTNMKLNDIISESAPVISASVPDPSRFLIVNRPDSIENGRRQLPVYMEEQSIMEAVNSHDQIIICGATGSGKTTQIPQFLYEAGYGSLPGRSASIAITQPRRVAAVSMADRVRQEMGDHGDRVAYQIRYDSHQVHDRTAIKFMTDGILLREIQRDFLLRSYSVVIIDEAHERSLNTDVLIGLLSRIVPLRRRTYPESPLKLIIMSATLQVQDFAENRRLFPDHAPPVVQVEGRQHPVTIHFSKRTASDYITATINKITAIHRKLPSGGILAFVAGKHDINIVINKLRQRLQSDDHSSPDQSHIDRDRFWSGGHDQIDADDDLLDDRRIDDDDDDDDENQKGGGDGSDLECDIDGDDLHNGDDVRPCVIVPLHALLSAADQSKVFQPLPSADHRLIVVATNVAETSLTLPNIKYVVDSGREKRRLYDPVTGLSSLNVTFISRPSADQRAGRAGRIGPGHVYRLYSKAVYDQELDGGGAVEINECPIDFMILSLKSMSINDVIMFPFPTPPPALTLQSSLTLLIRLGALSTRSPHLITSIGRYMSTLPLSPRYGRMISIAATQTQYQDCLPYLIAVVSIMSLENSIFIRDDQENSSQSSSSLLLSYRQIREKWSDPLSDLLGNLAMVLAYDFTHDQDQFCRDNYLRPRAMFEISRLRRQLYDQLGLGPVSGLNPPTSDQRSLLCQMIGAGFCDRIARRHISVPGAYECLGVSDPVYLHHDSDLAHGHAQPDLVAYTDMIHSSSSGQIRIRGLTRLRSQHLYGICPQLCQLSPRPRPDRPAQYDRDQDRIQAWYGCTYGPGRWPLPDVLRVPSSFKYERVWFIRLLLQGDILSSWRQLGPWLAYRPSTITEIQAQTRPVMDFVNQFTSGLTSRSALLNRWAQDPSFLQAQARNLIQRSCRDRFDLIWSQLIK